MVNFISKLLPSFLSKTKETREPISPKAGLIEELKKSSDKQKGLNHEQLVLIAAIWFNLDLSSKAYRLKNHRKYGQFFLIRSIGVDWGNDPEKINDLTLVLVDAAFDTGFAITVSLRCFDEWLEPVNKINKPPAGQPQLKIE